MQRIKKIFFPSLFIFSGLAFFTPAEAAIIYVDKGKSCPGTGTSTAPFCSIQGAFNAVKPGDVIRIRSSSSPYDESAIAKRSGTASAPITVEPDIGHRPTLRYSGRNAQTGVIEIRDADYWRIRGLTFDGKGIQTSRHAIILLAFSRNITGHQIVNNKFLNWGGTGENTREAATIALRPRGNSNLHVTSSVISSNTFDRSVYQAIRLNATQNIIVEDNLIQNMQCGRGPSGRVGATGIKSSQESTGNIIRSNVVRDHQRSNDCTIPNQGTAKYAGIYCDTGSARGQIIGNVVSNIDRGQTVNTNPRADGISSVGIQLESRCHDWRVQNNSVSNVGIHGLRNGSPSTGDPNNNQWTNNTVFGISRTAFWVARGRNLIIKNNILVHQGTVAIEVHQAAASQGGHDINHNLYWDMENGTKVGKWSNHKILNLASWRNACKCDAAALATNPSFLNAEAGDFQLSASSVAVGTGEGSIDMGAFSAVAPPQ
jgi:hypothetical protein